jgi:hypothetical protein
MDIPMANPNGPFRLNSSLLGSIRASVAQLRFGAIGGG